MFIDCLKKSLVGVGCVWFILQTPAVLAEPTDGQVTALQAAIALNPAIRGKQAEVSSTNCLGDSARALRYPTLSAQVSVLDNDSQSGNLTVRQPLWAFGRIDDSIAYADADSVLELADLERVKRDLMDKTASAYARVQGVMKRLAIADDNVAALQILYEQIQRREQGQLASIADVRLANARWVQAKAQKVRYEGEYDVAKNELYALTQTTIQVQEQVDSSITLLPSLAQLLVLSLDKSAEIYYKNTLLALAKAAVEREKSSVMPTLNLQVQHFTNSRSDVNRNSDTQISVVLEASLDGFGFSAKGRNRSFAAKVDAAWENVAATRNEINRAVNSFYRNRESQQRLIDAQAQSVDELQDILKSYQRQYDAGRKAWLDVLNIQQELTEQRLQRAQAQNDWLIFSLKLAVLTGQLDPLVSKKGILSECC